jgi:hypothetical protein
MPFPPRRSSPPVSHDDYFPHNQNKNDLAETRSFLVRVERVELRMAMIEEWLNLADFGWVEPRHRVATVVRDRLVSSTFVPSWATGGQHQLGRGRRWLAAPRGAGDRRRHELRRNGTTPPIVARFSQKRRVASLIYYRPISSGFATSWATHGQRLGEVARIARNSRRWPGARNSIPREHSDHHHGTPLLG